jgi:hypothetical protein
MPVKNLNMQSCPYDYKALDAKVLKTRDECVSESKFFSELVIKICCLIWNELDELQKSETAIYALNLDLFNTESDFLAYISAQPRCILQIQDTPWGITMRKNSLISVMESFLFTYEDVSVVDQEVIIEQFMVSYEDLCIDPAVIFPLFDTMKH